MAVVLTLVETKQIEMNTHRIIDETNTVQTIQNTGNISTYSKYNIRYVKTLSIIYILIKDFILT